MESPRNRNDVSDWYNIGRRGIRKDDSDLKSLGEPDAVKVARPVRRGAVGKVPVKVTRWLPTLLKKRGVVRLMWLYEKAFRVLAFPGEAGFFKASEQWR